MKYNPFDFMSLDELKVYGHLFYSSVEGSLFIELPAGLHGGAKPDGEKFDELQESIAAFLTDKGFVACFIDKRGSRGYGADYMKLRDFCKNTVDDIVEGTKKAMMLCQKEKAIIHGTSSSATEALIAAAKTRNFYERVILTSGFYDIPKQINYEVRHRGIHPTKMLTDHLSEEELCKRNPLRYLESIPSDTKFLIIHGEDDHVVPYEQSRGLASALQKRGIRVDLLSYQSFPHTREASNPTTKFGRKYWSDIVRWINEQQH